MLGKVRENRLRYFGHVIRREESKAVRMMMKINLGGKIGIGNLKRRLLI